LSSTQQMGFFPHPVRKGSGMKKNVIQIHPKDNVAVAVVEIKEGEVLEGVSPGGLRAVTTIPRLHKVALCDMATDAPVIKYGEKIAVAASRIRAGEWVHIHNTKAQG
jgi:altronate dehydratase